MSDESFIKQILDENLRLRHVIRRMCKETDKNAQAYIKQSNDILKKDKISDADRLESICLKDRGIGYLEANKLLLEILIDEGFNYDMNLIR